MDLFWKIMAVFAICGLAVLLLFRNIPRVIFNLRHKKKKIIRWNPLEFIDSEDFYKD